MLKKRGNDYGIFDCNSDFCICALWHDFSGAEISAEEVISHTNIARRKAKENLSCICEYTHDLADAELRRAETIHSFQKALAQKEFLLYFQPKISGITQKIASAEVLVRWQRSDGTLWFPDSFLPILEET